MSCIPLRWTNAMHQIALLTEIMRMPTAYSLVQEYAAAVIACVDDAVQANFGVVLLWPVIIAGSVIAGPNRGIVIKILSCFR